MIKLKSKFWEHTFFDLYNKGDDIDQMMGTIFGTVVGVFLSFITIGPLLDLATGLPGLIWLPIALLFGPVLLQGLFRIGRLHRLHGIENLSSRNIMRRYYSLSKEDRKEFPANIEQAIRNPHLTNGQRFKLADNMASTMDAINARNAAKQQAIKYDINIDDVLEQLEQARNGVRVEAAVYKEYNDPKVITGRL